MFEQKFEYFERKLKNWKALQKDNSSRVKKFSDSLVDLELRMKDMLEENFANIKDMHKHHVEAMAQLQQTVNLHNSACLYKVTIFDDLKGEIVDLKVKCDKVEYWQAQLTGRLDEFIESDLFQKSNENFC